jgi:outer membrane protein TolC
MKRNGNVMNKIMLLLILLFQFDSIVSGQKIDTIKINSLDKLWELAIKNNSNQKVYNLKNDQAIYDSKTAHGILYPQAEFSFSGQNNIQLATTPVPGEVLGQPGKTMYLQFGNKFTYNSGITISKSLFDWQQIIHAKIANENIALTKAQQDAFIQTLKNQIAQYYYSLLIANESLDISNKDLLFADSIVQITRQRFQQGLIDVTAANSASINYNNVQQNIFQTNELKKQAITNIKILAGITNDENLGIGDTISFDSFDDKKNIEIGIDKNLKVYPHNILISEYQRKEQQSILLPKFSLLGYFGVQQFRDDFSMSFNKGAWTDYRYIGLNMTWPIFTGFTNSNKLKSVTVQKKIVEEQYKSASEQSKINDTALRDSYINYWNITYTAKSTLQLYALNLQLNQQKFREGLISIDNYFKIFEDYLHSENTYLTNLSNLLSVQASIISRK